MSIALRLLLVEDSEKDAMLLLRHLRRSKYRVTVERVDTSAAMLAALNTQTWDLIICDYSMPQFSAFAALKLLQDSGLDLPFIIVSGTIGEDTAVAAMKAGAHDYILKGNFTRLVPAIERELCEAEVRLARRRVEEQLKASLQEKEVLLKEIHHRVKNNFQIISSLLNLQSNYIQDKQDLEFFKISQRRIEAMALLHEKLYQSQDLARINAAEYIPDLVSSLFYSYEVTASIIDLKLNIEPVFLSLDAAIPCGLIINELVLNSLKHAFSNKTSGGIFVAFSRVINSRFILIVSDNGIGLPEDFDFRNTESLGLQLVNALTSQLLGTIELDRSRGTEFKITFLEDI